MSEQPYLYQIIRYVPDLRRMEPQNIGVIVQGKDETKCRLWTHFRPSGDKPNFDFSNFRKWRNFFETEINGPQIKLFQPPRQSPKFLEYLQSRCKGNYILTRPLHLTMRTSDIEEVTETLYQTLVKSPEEEPEPSELPVRSFREQLQEKRLDRNPLFRRDEYLNLPNGQTELFHWQYVKNHGSNQKILIDKVQWLGRIRLTQLELEHVLIAVKKVRENMSSARLIVIMDPLDPPSRHAKDSTKRLYENYQNGKNVLANDCDEVVSTVVDTEKLVVRIESDLKEAIQYSN